MEKQIKSYTILGTILDLIISLFGLIACFMMASIVGINYIIPYENFDNVWKEIFNITLWAVVNFWCIDTLFKALTNLKNKRKKDNQEERQGDGFRYDIRHR